MYESSDEDLSKTKSKKNTRKWCKGKVGKEHVPIVSIDTKMLTYVRECHWREYSWTVFKREPEKRWQCHHHTTCQNCGKVLESWYLTKDKCPDYKEYDGPNSMPSM